MLFVNRILIPYDESYYHVPVEATVVRKKGRDARRFLMFACRAERPLVHGGFRPCRCCHPITNVEMESDAKNFRVAPFYSLLPPEAGRSLDERASRQQIRWGKDCGDIDWLMLYDFTYKCRLPRKVGLSRATTVHLYGIRQV